MTFNARSIRSKLRRDVIEAQSEVESFDVLIITESWLTEEFLDSHISLDNYTVAARAERKKVENSDRSPGGGVIIYVKSGIKFHSPIVANINEYSQIAAIKIKDLRIVGVYRNPGRNVQFDENSVNYIRNQFADQSIVLTGDFNLPGVNWETGSFGNRSEEQWVNLSIEMTLHQYVNGVTRPKDRKRGNYGNCLDLIFSRSSHSLDIDNVTIDPQMFSLSDHHCVHFVANTIFTRSVKNKVVLDIKNADWECYKSTMRSQNVIPRTNREECVINKWDCIESVINNAKSKACKEKVIIQGKAPRWMSLSLQKALKKERRLRHLSKKSANSSVKRQRLNRWRYQHKWVKCQMRKARLQFESSKVLNYEKDHKSLFRDMKRARTTNMASPPINDLEGRVMVTDKDKAEAFQAKFAKVFTPVNSNINIDWPTIDGGLNDVIFSNAKIKSSIKSLKIDSAPGSDNIGPVFYKNADLTLIFALSDLFQQCFDNCVLPPKFLLSKVIAIFKNKGLICEIKNYRGITLMCIAFKIMEKIIVWEIDAYLIANGLLDDWQHGFQRQKSCVTNLIDTWEFLSSKLDKKENWITLSVDLSSAFDSLSIKHLMIALKAKGIGGKLGRFLEYWLSNRSQYVQVGDDQSDPIPCPSGVPQGSTGGPVYFSMLISYVYRNLAVEGQNIGLKFWAFADDTRLAFKAETEEKFVEAQRVLTKFANGLAEVGLKLNPSKSVMVYYGNQKLKRHLAVDGVNIPIENSSLELGCIFSNNLSFKPCLDRNISKARAFIFTVRNTLKVRNYSVMKKLYNIYLAPILLYSCQVWHSHHKYVIEGLHRVYRRFWRLGMGKIVPGPEILDPFQMSVKHIMMFLFKVKQGKTGLRNDNFFRQADRTMTRSDNPLNLRINCNRLVSRDGFFTTLAAKWFNELPDHLKAEGSIAKFKEGLIQHILITHPTPVFDYRPWRLRQN